MLELDLTQDEIPFGTNIKIIGVGGSGGNAINTMIDNSLTGVEFIAANTDITDLKKSKAKIKLQLGKETTKGLGAGANPEIGRKSAEESRDDIRSQLEGADLVFIAAGMGGGTGTGAAPVIATLAKELGILTIGIVNRPFLSEGKKRMLNAEAGIHKLRDIVDTLIVVPNEKLKDIYPDMTVIDAFRRADNVLYEAAKAVSDIINSSGYIKVDFADVRTVMANRGFALMGSAVGEGDDRARKAIQEAMSNPLLTEVKIDKCPGILINITAGKDFRMEEFEIISKEVNLKATEASDIITGIIFDQELEGKIKVTLIATGLKVNDNSVYEIESIRSKGADTPKEEISDMLDRIRSTNNNQDISKKQQRSTREEGGSLQMDIPAFMRKFSN
ncbi:MAG: cell division protein FtsZ [Candidatus Cloacimonetes bacterium]|nr:cell division protein FtsZ [Candidatus Cloacimonadota bacterium]